MGSVLVVLGQPVLGDGLHPLDRVEQIGIEYLGAKRPVELLDVGVLVGLAGLDVVQGNAFALVASRAGDADGGLQLAQAAEDLDGVLLFLAAGAVEADATRYGGGGGLPGS